jgi:endoglycosylceramidase
MADWKNISILLFTIITVFCAAACGGSGDDDDSSSSSGDDSSPTDDSGGTTDDSGDDAADDTLPSDDSADDSADDTDDGDWKFIRDDQGGAIIFHGCNFDGNAKNITGLPQRTEEDAAQLADTWGFNFLRYLIFWARIEPQEGVYDEDYLDAVEDWLDILADNGFAVVLDMHQDVWGPYVRGGADSDGAPEWATVTDGMPHIPFSTWTGAWAFDYISPDIMRAFDNFWNYDEHPELQDHYAAMWAHVAERFKDHPAVLGYDIMNEPWQGMGLARYRYFDEMKYSDFNQRMIDALRDVDSEAWIFYEPCAFLTNQAYPQFMRVLNDPRDGPARLVYYPHLYPVRIDLAGGYLPDVDDALPRWEGYRRGDSEKQRAPLLAGEWSMLRWFDDENRHLWINDTLRMLERVSAGWSYWECGGFLGDADETFRALIASVYPRRVAGTPVSYGYDPETRVFEMVFSEREGTSGPTEIFIPEEREYPSGWTVTSSDPDDTWSWQWDETARILSITSNADNPTHTIRIEPRE